MAYTVKFYIHILAASLVFIAVCVAAWYIFGMITDMSVRVENVKRDLAILELKRNQIQEITKKYEAVKEDVAKLDDVFLDRRDKLSFIRLVEDLERQYSVREVIDAPDEPLAKKDQKTQGAKEAQAVPFNINITGPFSNVLRFIDALEQSRYLTSIETVQISRGAAAFEAAQSEVQAQFIANVYAK